MSVTSASVFRSRNAARTPSSTAPSSKSAGKKLAKSGKSSARLVGRRVISEFMQSYRSSQQEQNHHLGIAIGRAVQPRPDGRSSVASYRQPRDHISAVLIPDRGSEAKARARRSDRNTDGLTKPILPAGTRKMPHGSVATGAGGQEGARSRRSWCMPTCRTVGRARRSTLRWYSFQCTVWHRKRGQWSNWSCGRSNLIVLGGKMRERISKRCRGCSAQPVMRCWCAKTPTSRRNQGMRPTKMLYTL
jgi:hypothetical protein